MEVSQKVEKGQKIYSNLALAIYNFLVLLISSNFIWRCPTRILLSNFNKNISSNHLDIGTWAGYFLDNCKFSATNPRIAPIDLNQNCLDKIRNRISRYNVEKYRLNILEEVTVKIKKFDSISLNYLIHCLPENLSTKSIIFDNAASLLSKNGSIFGSTILSDTANEGFLTGKLMEI